jgi:hypothetical protein
VNSFRIYACHGPLEISEDSSVPEGDAHIYTQQGNRHTVWAPQSLDEALKSSDAVLALGEDPFGVAMNPKDYERLHDMVLNGPLGLMKVKKAKVCECGSAKAKLPTHSSWCPVNS